MKEAAANVSHPDPVTTRVRLPIDGSRSEAGLSSALDALIRVASNFPKSLGENEDEEVPPFLVVTFHGNGRWLSERRFFERAARHADLRPKVARYLSLVNPKAWKSDPFGGSGFWTSILAPAGSLAAVPLALSDRAFIDVAIEQMRGSDLDHETFQRSFIAELVSRYGICEETLRLLAFRAVDGQGQNGEHDLRWQMSQGAFAEYVNGDGGLERFAELVAARSKRTSYLALYVANAGKGLFGDSPGRFAEWLRYFEARGLVFDDGDRALGENEPFPPKPWESVWEEAASCDERD